MKLCAKSDPGGLPPFQETVGVFFSAVWYWFMGVPDGRDAFNNVVRGADGGPYACPCCGYVTLPRRGGFDICPVCFWEDDGQDDQDANDVRGGPNADLSLSLARENYLRLGACARHFVPNVRQPTSEEYPPSN
jgi:hypothetical protein